MCAVSGRARKLEERHRAVHARHHHVEQDHVGARDHGQGDPLGAGRGEERLEAAHAGEADLADLPDVGLVVDQQDLRDRHGRAATLPRRDLVTFPVVPQAEPTTGRGPSTIGRYEALDRIAAEGLSEMVRLVADVCEVERCVLGLGDAVPGPIRTLVGAPAEEGPSYAPLLAHAALEGGLVVVPDALAAAALAADPLVAGGAVRFFAGAPVRGEGGAPLGVLGLFDPSPRRLDARAAAAFTGLARQIGVQLDLRRRVDAVREKHIEHLDALHVLAGLLGAATTLAIIGTDPAGRITTFSEGAERLLDVPAARVVGRASPVVFLDPAELEASAREATRALGRRVTGFEALVASSGAGRASARGPCAGRPDPPSPRASWWAPSRASAASSAGTW